MKVQTTDQQRMRAVPVSFAEACAFVRDMHRHHKPPQGHKFSIGAALCGSLVGVVMVGRPVSRMLDDGETLEVTRMCTDGTPNACSFLYGAAARSSFAMGYSRIGTYILASEQGTTLVASGWRLVGSTRGGSWSRDQRVRIDAHPTQAKLRFERVAP